MKEITTKEFKEIGVSILEYIDCLCRSNDIKYSIGFGTLIGAIRHQGYIPWDDDIDIMIMRSDYNKLLGLILQDDKYNLISMENDSNYYYEFARVCDKATTLTRRKYRYLDNFGVWIDIFPVDVAPPDAERNKWLKEFKILRKRMKYIIPSHYETFTFFAKILHPLSFVKEYYYRYTIGVKAFSHIRERFSNHIKKYNSNLTDTCEVMIADQPYEFRCCFPKCWMDDVIDVVFDRIHVMALSHYDEYLKKIYGNYMELPPANKRVSNHHFKAWWK